MPDLSRRMKTVGLVTELIGPDLSPGDSLLLSPLEKHGIIATPVPWDDAEVDWSRYDGLVLRACWHYPEKEERFRIWINELDRQGINLWNNSAVVMWNMDKRYLQDLEQKQVPVVSTVWLALGDAPDINQVLREQGWQEAVIKPQISTSSDNTWQVKYPVDNRVQAEFEQMSEKRALMIQRLVPEISQGEWSVIFLEERFAHAVIKQPREGEIFVQEHRGGIIRAATPSPALVAEAAQIVGHAKELTGSDLLYARVDGLVVDNHLTLMELELIEPSLYLRHHPPSADLFAEAIAQKLF